MTVRRGHGRLSEFRYLLNCWDQGDDRFVEIVDCGLDIWPDGRQELAGEFQVADSTVDRWARGSARPHRRLKFLIVGYLRQKLLDSSG